MPGPGLLALPLQRRVHAPQVRHGGNHVGTGQHLRDPGLRGPALLQAPVPCGQRVREPVRHALDVQQVRDGHEAPAVAQPPDFRRNFFTEAPVVLPQQQRQQHAGRVVLLVARVVAVVGAHVFPGHVRHAPQHVRKHLRFSGNGQRAGVQAHLRQELVCH